MAVVWLPRNICNSGACVLLDGVVIRSSGITPVWSQKGVRLASDGKVSQNVGHLTLPVRTALENAACNIGFQAHLP